MCYRPIHIKNRKIEFNVYSDCLNLDVPCGNCCECNYARLQEWRVRSYYEYLQAYDNNAIGLYVTLTFAPEHLPSVCFDGSFIPCFDKRKVQLFLKRLRSYLPKGSFLRYFVCSEYGGKTHRPHHHCTLYFYNTGLSDLTLKRFVHDAWQYGFISFGKFGGVINSAFASLYVTKYITKDFDFDYTKVSDTKYHPFHLQSKGYGSYMIEKENLYSLDDSTLEFFVKGKSNYPFIPQNVEQPTIPLYIVRKILFDLDKVHINDELHYIWRLNDFGRKVKFQRFFIDIYNTENTINKYKSIQFLDGYELEIINKITGENFTDITSLWQALSVDSHELAIYCQVYRNKAYKFNNNYYDCFSADTLRRVRDTLFGFVETGFEINLSEVVYHVPHDKFERVLSIIKAVKFVVGRRKEDEFFKKKTFESEFKMFENFK